MDGKTKNHIVSHLSKTKNNIVSHLKTPVYIRAYLPNYHPNLEGRLRV
ncbi:hypothetical protein BAZOLSSOX_198 [uncultured Gammaproteobacteria bacterium]|nr:hypothetical protein BAZOLSSOX_198 [uncultured Gammaproteobacteria bacterium]